MAHVRIILASILLTFCSAVPASAQIHRSHLDYSDGHETKAKWAHLYAYINTYNYDGIINDPQVNLLLQQLLGGEMDHLFANLAVHGRIEVIDGTLIMFGNAPHMGGEEDALLQVYPAGDVFAVIQSGGKFHIYEYGKRPLKYEYMDRFVRTWIYRMSSRTAYDKPLSAMPDNIVWHDKSRE